MKRVKKIAAMLILAMLLCCVSCSFRCGGPGIYPVGLWRSEDPDLMLDMNPQEFGEWRGEYIQNGEVTKLEILFMTAPNTLLIRDAESENYFGGSYYVKDNKLYIEQTPAAIEKTGYETIILDLVEEYEIPEDFDVYY